MRRTYEICRVEFKGNKIFVLCIYVLIIQSEREIRPLYKFFIINNQMTKRIAFFLLLIVCISCQILKNKWEISTIQKSRWQQLGLNQTKGICEWFLHDLSQIYDIYLYTDDKYQNYLELSIYLNYSINKVYPFYDGLAHAEYLMHQNGKTHQKIVDPNVMPYVKIFNKTITVVEGNSTLSVYLHEQTSYAGISIISVLHLLVKFGLFSKMIVNARNDAGMHLSLSFLYIILGVELQSYLLTMQLFRGIHNSSAELLGFFIGTTGYAYVIFSLFYMPRPVILWQSIEGLIYYMFICFAGPGFSQESKIIMYAISPLLQARFSIIRKIKNKTCPYALSVYFLNLLMLYYIKGCPACPLRFSLNIPICVVATLIGIGMLVLLEKQRRDGPLMCFREMIEGKSYEYLQEINLSEGQEMNEDVCSICLMAITDVNLVERVSARGEKRTGMVMKTPCNHLFHPDCLRKWLQQKNTCPLDNREIPPCYE